jgi:hypothetical protein
MNAESAPKKRRNTKAEVISKAETDSFVDGLKNEWSLFWDSLTGEDKPDEKDDAELLPPPSPLTLEQVKALTKALSADRKRLNLKLEEIRHRIEESSARLESLKMVGSSEEETFQLISELNDQGQKIAEQLNKVDERLRLARRREDEIKNSARPS